MRLNFVKSDLFRFEAYVIKDLTHDVVLGRDFLQEYCLKLDFIETTAEFSHPEDPLPFPDGFGDWIWMLKLMLIVFCLYIPITLLLFLPNLQ